MKIFQVFVVITTLYISVQCLNSELLKLNVSLTKSTRDLLNMFDRAVENNPRVQVAIRYFLDTAWQDMLQQVRNQPSHREAERIIMKHNTIYGLFLRKNLNDYEQIVNAKHKIQTPSFEAFVSNKMFKKKIRQVKKLLMFLEKKMPKRILAENTTLSKLKHLSQEVVRLPLVLKMQGILRSMALDPAPYLDLFLEAVSLQIALQSV